MLKNHENFNRKNKIIITTNRKFGLLFASVFFIIALWSLQYKNNVWPTAGLLSGIFLFVSLIAPHLLKPLNIIWFKFGQLLHKFVNPIIMGLIFVTTIIPIGFILRLKGKDLLRLKIDNQAQSYWIERDQDSLTSSSMHNQF